MLTLKTALLPARRVLQQTWRCLQESTSFIRIVEVGPRDGLQNEAKVISTNTKIEFINKLSETGLKTIEVTSFVSPKWVPQMADGVEVFKGIRKKPKVSYPVLVPNMMGLDKALEVGAEEVAVFASASEGFSQKNINCSIHESLNRIRDVAGKAHARRLKVRGYVSCIAGCPYDGEVRASAVARVVDELLSIGCYQVSLGDTIGVGTRRSIGLMFEELLRLTTADKLAIHCHDTYGQALVNVCVALDAGVEVVDAAVSGLGGCPYATGATGNVATEDLVYMLHGLGANTGVDLQKLIDVGHFISEKVHKPTASKVNRALYKKHHL